MTETLADSAPGVSTSIKHAARMRLLCFLALAVAAAIAGARETMDPEHTDRGPIVLLLPLFFSLLGASWCFFDGQVRGKRPARIGLMLIVIGLPIGFPVYCLWSRGLRGLLVLLGFVCMLFVASGLGAAIVLAISQLTNR